MSLKLLTAREVTPYIQNVVQNSQDPPNGAGSFSGLGGLIWNSTSSIAFATQLHLPSDRFYSAISVRSAGQGSNGWCYFDPNYIAFGPGNSDYVNGSTTGSTSDFLRLYIDQFNEQTGQQRMFSTNVSQFVRELFPITMLENSSVFTGPNGQLRMSVGTVANFNWNSGGPSGGCFFTGLKNGIPNETFETGSNVYPDGLVLVSDCGGNVNGVAFDNRFAWIDIRTTRCVGMLGATNVPAGNFTPVGWPGRTNTSILENSEAPIGGDQFRWAAGQYIADDDATYAIPKGRILTSSFEELPNNQTIIAGVTQRVYVRLTEFNPLGASASPGNPTRVHGRIRLTSRIVYEIAPPYGLAGQLFRSNVQAGDVVLFDVLRNRFHHFQSETTQLGQTFPPAVTTGFQTAATYSTQADVAFITNPASIDPVRTNDVSDFEAVAVGDLGERISGVTANWTLTRRSTINEILTITGGIGTTSTLANPPVDQITPAVNEGSLSITADGVPLAETTDYTVDLNTGIITWVTDQQGALQVLASYEHRNTSASPAHGALITTSSLTDQDGIATTRVSYPDDDAIVGGLDNLEVTQG